MAFERRDAEARAARDRLADLLGVEARTLASLDALVAASITRALLHPTGGTAGGRLSNTAQRLLPRMFGPRFFRWRRAARSSPITRQPWRLFALVELAVMFAAIGVAVGVLLRLSGGAGSPAPAVHNSGANRPAAVPTISSVPSALPALSASTPGGDLVGVAVAALEAKVALPYMPAGCVGVNACLHSPSVTTGDGAAYVEVTVQGMPAGAHCLVYLHSDGGEWGVDRSSCGDGANFAPMVGATVPVTAPGGCARVRRSPGLAAPVIACLHDGTEVGITAAPTYRDGHLWFPITGTGVSGVMALEVLRFNAL